MSDSELPIAGGMQAFTTTRKAAKGTRVPQRNRERLPVQWLGAQASNSDPFNLGFLIHKVDHHTDLNQKTISTHSLRSGGQARRLSSAIAFWALSPPSSPISS